METAPRGVRRILLIEDSPADAKLVRIGFEEIGRAVDLHVVGDGEEAFAFLRGQEPHAGAGRPDLLVLDLNLPRMDGRTFLRELKADAALAHLPVVVLSTSAADRDVRAAYAAGASAFMVKPADYDGLVALARAIAGYWLSAVVLPERDGAARPPSA